MTTKPNLAKRELFGHYEIRKHEVCSALFLYLYYRLKKDAKLSHQRIEMVMTYCFDFIEADGKTFIKDIEKYYGKDLGKTPLALLKSICDAFGLSDKEFDVLYILYLPTWIDNACTELEGDSSYDKIKEILWDIYNDIKPRHLEWFTASSLLGARASD